MDFSASPCRVAFCLPHGEQSYNEGSSNTLWVNSISPRCTQAAAWPSLSGPWHSREGEWLRVAHLLVQEERWSLLLAQAG